MKPRKKKAVTMWMIENTRAFEGYYHASNAGTRKEAIRRHIDDGMCTSWTQARLFGDRCVKVEIRQVKKGKRK